MLSRTDLINIGLIKTYLYQFVCDRNLRTMRAKRTACARQNTLDMIGLDWIWIGSTFSR